VRVQYSCVNHLAYLFRYFGPESEAANFPEHR